LMAHRVKDAGKSVRARKSSCPLHKPDTQKGCVVMNLSLGLRRVSANVRAAVCWRLRTQHKRPNRSRFSVILPPPIAARPLLMSEAQKRKGSIPQLHQSKRKKPWPS
jgi:hypothetical protein